MRHGAKAKEEGGETSIRINSWGKTARKSTAGFQAQAEMLGSKTTNWNQAPPRIGGSLPRWMKHSYVPIAVVLDNHRWQKIAYICIKCWNVAGWVIWVRKKKKKKIVPCVSQKNTPKKSIQNIPPSEATFLTLHKQIMMPTSLCMTSLLIFSNNELFYTTKSPSHMKTRVRDISLTINDA